MPCSILDRITALETEVKDLDAGATGTKSAKGKTPSPERVFGAPAVRKGENALGSRGFSFLKLAGAMAKVIDHDQAKVEAEVADVFHKSFSRTGDYKHGMAGSVLAPLGVDYLPDSHRGESVFQEIKSLVTGGTEGADPDEIAWLRRKFYGQKATGQSWLDQSLGGALVPGPEQGELIDLLRYKDALINAGARTVPLPPQGSIAYPRQLGHSTGYWIGENAEFTGSQVKTGSLLLSGKKVGALIKMPNELIRFASPAAEALFRADMIKTLTLTMDAQLLHGQGSDTRPTGLLNTPGVATVTPTTVAADGNTLAAEDVYSFLSKVEENNAEFEGWVLRPSLFYKLYARRADAVSTADGKGQFLFNLIRGLGDKPEANIAGYKATLSAQVSNARTKGSASNLTYVVGGMWSDYLLGMFGAIEFAAATQGDAAFAHDQTVIRALLTCDGGARHPGAFAVADQLKIA